MPDRLGVGRETGAPVASRSPHKSVLWSGLLLCVAVGMAACSESTAPPLPGSIELTSGGSQDGTVGEPLSQLVVFEVRDDGGNPVAGVGVSLAVTQGGGSVPDQTVITGPEGMVQTPWTLGTVAAAAQRLEATAGAFTASATATARAGAPATIEVVAGAGQTAPAGTFLPDSLAVVVSDQYGNPVPNAVVTWIAQLGGGSLAPVQVNAGPDGIARARWTLGGGAGAHTAVAQAGQAPAAAFEATALPNAAIAGTVTLSSGLLAGVALSGFTVAGATFGAGAELQSPGGVRSTSTVPDGLAGAGGAALQPGASSALSGPGDAIPGEWVLRFREGTISAPSGGVSRLSGATAMSEGIRAAVSAIPVIASARAGITGVSPLLGAVRVSMEAGGEEAAVVASLRADPRVASVEPLRWVSSHAEPAAMGTPIAASPFVDGLFFPRQSWHYGMIGVPRAWDVTEGSTSVIVAVVDDGIRVEHVSMAGVLTNDGYDFVKEPAVPIPHCSGGNISLTGDGDGPDPDPTNPSSYSLLGGPNCATGPNDFGGHGLHVAGTIAAAGSGVVGVAPRVRIRPVRVLGTTGQGTNYDVAQGILYAAGLPADDGAGGLVQAPSAARVINMSIGSPASDPVIAGAISQASAAGSLLIASAGNSGNSLPQYPAALPETVSVSALGPDFLLAPYSTWGPTVDVAAPGGSMSVYGSFGGGIWSAWWSFSESASYIGALHGTSMAAPHVSGLAALLFSQNPGMTAAQAKERIYATTRDLGVLGKDQLFGHGLVDAFLALTNGAGFPSTLRVSLYDASTGAKIEEVEAGSDHSFNFSGLTDGNYLVYAGTDDRDDGITGRPGFVWGARGGTPQPAVVAIQGNGIQDGSLTAGIPIEVEPNNSTGLAHSLPIGGYMYGSVGSFGDQDHYRVLVPTQGTYSFETGGATGLCGFGLEVNTRLDLLDALGVVITSNDDLNAADERLCSKIVAQLAPGTYFLRVRASFGGATGNYSIRAY